VGKELKLTLKVDAQTGKVTQVSDEVLKFDKAVNQAKTGVNDLKNFIMKFTGGLYVADKAIDIVKSSVASFFDTASQFEQYGNRMGAFTSSLTEQQSEMARARKFAMDYNQSIEKTTETLLLMKNYGLKDSNEQLKTYVNTAIGSGKSIEQFAEAMADALQGENERLKEFGTKASVQGQKVAYGWTDSMGRARNIIIDNNKEIIDSTLSAIFTEKYAGQAEKYKNTWAGTIQGIKNKWTDIELAIADEGLFKYLTSVVSNVSNFTKDAFNSGKGSAKGFVDSVVSGINSMIEGAGVLSDAFSLFGGVWDYLKVAFWQLVGVIGTGINTIQEVWNKLGNKMSQLWADVANGVKDMFAGMINWIIDKINSLSSSLNSAAAKIPGVGKIFGKIDHVSFEKTKADIISMGVPVSNVATAWQYASEARDEYKKNFKDLEEGAGHKKALELVKKINKEYKKAAATNDEEIAKKEREKARKYLEDHGAAYGDLTQQATKAGDAEKKAASDAAKAAKEAAKAQDEWLKAVLGDEGYEIKQLGDKLAGLGKYLSQAQLADIYAAEMKKIESKTKDTVSEIEKEAQRATEAMSSMFSGIFESMLHGDFAGAFNQIIDTGTRNVSDALGKAATNIFSGKGIGDAFGSLSTGDWISATLQVIGGLLSSTVTQEEIDASKGRVEFDDNSLKNLGDVFENAQYPMLEVTNKMFKHIRNMDANFYSIARAFSLQASAGGIDLTGANFVGTQKVGFLGFSSKSVSLIGTGLKFELQTLSELMDEATLNVRSYTTTLVQKSSFFGLSNSTKIRETYKDLPASVIDDIASAFTDGYEAIMTAGISLGLDKVNLENLLFNSNVDIGKVDFTGLSPSEVSDRLSQVFSTALSGVVDDIEEFASLTERYAKDAEYSLETLIRIATEYEQASFSFGLIGKTFQDGVMSVTKTWSETMIHVNDDFANLPWITSAGYTSSFSNIFSGIWGKTEELTLYFSETYDALYTAQMQILDIVESAGGLTSFQDAMSSFMTNFYTEEEQLNFMTKSMEASFATLGITMPKTRDEFRSLLETMDTSTEESAYLYGQILLLSDGFAQMSNAAESLQEAVSGMMGEIADAWLSDLSYLSLSQKADYASGYFEIARQSNGALNAADAARMAAETAMKTATSKEEYIPAFNNYINELKKQNADATLSDVVKAVDMVALRVQELEETTRKAV